MEAFVMEGGRRLAGEVRPGGNKNAALPLLAAALLTEDPVTFHNVPRIIDVLTMMDQLRQVGCRVEWTGEGTVVVEARDVEGGELDPDLCQRIRASILLAGPMVARHGRVTLTPPGGDVIGRRRVDTHFQVLAALGADVAINHRYVLRAGRLQGAEITLDEPSVTGSENALMAASLARGTTVLHNVASEPHVCELARFLVAAGASIEGIGSNTLIVHGVDRLRGVEHTVGTDYIEAGSFMGLAAVTGGDVTVKGVDPSDFRMIDIVFRRMGVTLEFRDGDVRVPPGQELVIRDDAHGAVPKVDDGPWPAFPSDMVSIALVMATQCRGTVLFFEKMFESRLFFVDRLVSMGARIVVCDPHRAVVVGPAHLVGARHESPDIRAGMALLIAGLCAEGETIICNVRQIDRRYEAVEKKLQALGANIERRTVS